MTEEDLDALRAAAATLEHPGLAARLGNIAGKPIELVCRALPQAASEAVAAAPTKALNAALAVALRTMEKEPKAASRLLHKALAAASGAAGGGFGLAALPVSPFGPDHTRTTKDSATTCPMVKRTGVGQFLACIEALAA